MPLRKGTPEYIDYMRAYYRSNKTDILTKDKIKYQEQKEQVKQRVKQYRESNLEVVRQREKRKLYKRYWPEKTGAEALEAYNTLFAEQQGRCAICETHQSSLKHALVVDHNHLNGQVRGLLCHLCNRGLGQFKDTIENLEKAIKYLKPKGN